MTTTIFLLLLLLIFVSPSSRDCSDCSIVQFEKKKILVLQRFPMIKKIIYLKVHILYKKQKLICFGLRSKNATCKRRRRSERGKI